MEIFSNLVLRKNVISCLKKNAHVNKGKSESRSLRAVMVNIFINNIFNLVE